MALPTGLNRRIAVNRIGRAEPRSAERAAPPEACPTNPGMGVEVAVSSIPQGAGAEAAHYWPLGPSMTSSFRAAETDPQPVPSVRDHLFAAP